MLVALTVGGIPYMNEVASSSFTLDFRSRQRKGLGEQGASSNRAASGFLRIDRLSARSKPLDDCLDRARTHTEREKDRQTGNSRLFELGLSDLNV